VLSEAARRDLARAEQRDTHEVGSD
jgi:hypothetical protein